MTIRQADKLARMSGADDYGLASTEHASLGRDSRGYVVLWDSHDGHHYASYPTLSPALRRYRQEAW